MSGAMLRFFYLKTVQRIKIITKVCFICRKACRRCGGKTVNVSKTAPDRAKDVPSMAWKLTDNGMIATIDGNPVWQGEDGDEKAVDYAAMSKALSLLLRSTRLPMARQ